MNNVNNNNKETAANNKAQDKVDQTRAANDLLIKIDNLD
jgi:hypothetical protein